jgi:putative membrane protein
MNSKWKLFFARWTVTTVGVLVAANVVKGIDYKSITALLVSSLLLGVFNAILRPILMLLTLPLLILTLGLFTTVINAALLYLVGNLVRDFQVSGFGAAFWGGLVISIISLFLNAALGINDKASIRVNVNKGGPRNPPPPKSDGGASGPVIDV